ncbi:LuxR C-terminal-related transcriptional regulator [Pedococcus bigeumensis]|uniref:LuxR C-terminal-related transcriptional regulator n=1 Tax=Pedococcus bigeumensis TaxID=433644 RepID=UPI002FE890A5
MPGPLLSTKFYVPHARAATVDRARVTALLDAGAQTKLTLVSAQAGFGKTTAIATWVHGGPGADRVAWVSLESSDAQPEVFWTYVVTALAPLVPDLADSVLPLLNGSGPPMSAVLTEVVNRLADSPEPVVLILDDYHLVDGAPIAEGMTFLLTNLPHHVHVMLSTRADPDLPLSRLRARGEVVEVRAADLRFTAPETASYLYQAGLDLDAPHLRVLEDRTEGWAAALQLAALSMRGLDDVGRFVADFAGDDRFIVDYLVEEVLSRQPPAIRDFLLRTSVLDQLSGPLCDAVTGQSGGTDTLVDLERQNLFVIPLDARRRWYRYHHLFADVLRAHLAADTAGPTAAELHDRASNWFEDDGQLTPAVRHAVAAGDHEKAAALMEQAIPDLLRQRQEATVVGWVDVVPDDVVRARPVLAMGLISALMSRNEFPSVPARLDALESVLASAGGAVADVVAHDPSELPRLAGRAELYRAALALLAGDLPGTHQHVEQARALADADDHPTLAGTWGVAGLAHWTVGDLDAAHECYTSCVQELGLVGYVPDVLGCSSTLADLRVTQGRLHEAQTTLERALDLTVDQAEVQRGTADLHTGLAEVLLERGDLDGAESELRSAQDVGERAGLPRHPYRLRVAMALLRQERGDLAEATALLEEARRVYVADFAPDVRPVHATAARVLLAAGQLEAARVWAGEHQLSPTDELSYLREYEHVTLAMLLVAQARARHPREGSADASELLRRLHESARGGGRLGTLVEVIVLQALAADAAGRAAAAAAHIEQAVTIAEPEGHVRPFAQHGDALLPLLATLPVGQRDTAFVRDLQEACAGDEPHGAQGPVPSLRQDLVDPLSPRELDVLRLLATDLTGPELARHLVVSLNTLRTHTRNVYSKLGVSGRRAAVSRARELGLLGNSPR